MSDEMMRIDVNVEARSIFRILAIRTIVKDDVFANKLSDAFGRLLKGITITERIGDTKGHPDYLNYGKPHDGSEEGTDFESMSEERLCRGKEAFFGISEKDSLGTVVDYQVPLSSSDDAGEGVIDLISKNGNKIYIIEAKSWKSSEHPIRAMFEAITFWKMIGGKDDCSVFISRYNESKKNRNRTLPEGATAYPAILLREGSKIYKKMMDDDLGCYKELYKQISVTCQLRCFSYTKNDNNEIVIHDFTKDFVEERLGLRKDGNSYICPTCFDLNSCANESLKNF